MIYKWKPETTLRKHDPQSIGEHLEALRRRKSGLTPEILVTDAKRTTSPLHPVFDWNDTTAAEKYRLHQAGYLLRAIVTVIEEDTEHHRSTRAFVVVSDTDDGGKYTSIQVALSDPLYRAEILARARKELASWQARYAELEELADLFDAIKPHLSSTDGQTPVANAS